MHDNKDKIPTTERGIAAL